MVQDASRAPIAGQELHHGVIVKTHGPCEQRNSGAEGAWVTEVTRPWGRVDRRQNFGGGHDFGLPWPAGATRLDENDPRRTRGRVGSELGGPCRIAAGGRIAVRGGEASVRTRTVDEGTVEFETEAGQTYELTWPG